MTAPLPPEPAEATESTPGARGSVRIKRLVLAVFTMLLALGLAEGAVRLAGLGTVTLTRGRLHQADPDAGWICTPNLDARYAQPGSFDVRIVCNSQGQRGPELPYAKPVGTARIVVLGDSFMWGYGVEGDEMFATRLHAATPESEVVNLAANGYSTVQQLIRLETDGVKYEPDVVVLAFTWNDLDDNLDDKEGGRPVGALSPDGALEIRNRPVARQWKSPVKQWLRHNSRLFSLAEYGTALLKVERDNRRRAERRAARQANGGGAAARPAAEASPTDDEDATDGRDPLTILDVFGEPTPEAEVAWGILRATIRRVAETASERGARVLVMNNAAREAIFDRPLAAAAERNPEHPGSATVDKDRPAERLAAICAELGVEFLDTTPAFRDHADAVSLFLVDNGHWSAAGHALVAETAAPRVRALLSD